ncbi:MAG: hypothetical protein NZ921_04190 [Candidatus Caldarchaeum sp.]|nr:hypothetical protein [Candidatus Caldarchaeum sp.]
MPYFIRCVDEDTWLTESRSIATWRALEKLAKQLTPNEVLRLPLKRKIYSREEVSAWTNLFFKIREYRPSPSVDLSAFYVAPNTVDYEKLATVLGLKPEEAAVYVKSMDKPLMMAAVEEALQAVRHSYFHKHSVELVKGRV